MQHSGADLNYGAVNNEVIAGLGGTNLSVPRCNMPFLINGGSYTTAEKCGIVWEAVAEERPGPVALLLRTL